MAVPSLVRANQFVADAAGGTSDTFTTASSLGAGGAPAVGNLVVVVITTTSGSNPTAPGGWNPDRHVITSRGLGHASIHWYSRVITGGEAASYTWSGLGSGGSAVAFEFTSTDGSNWAADTGASDTGSASSVTSRAIGTSAALAAAGEAIVAMTSLTTPRTGYNVTGGPTFTEVAAASKFDHYASGVTSSTSALSLTGAWTSSSAVESQGFQTYYVVPPVTVSPSAVPLVMAFPTPDIRADQTATPSPVPMTMAFPTPDIRADQTASPSPAPMVMAYPAPSILSGVPVDSPSLAMSLLLPSPDIRADQTAFPSPVPMSMGFPAPTIVVTVPVFPTPVEMAFGFPAPLIASRFGPVPVFALGRAPATGPADRYPEPPYDPVRAAPPVQYRDGEVTYDPST